MHGCPHGTRDRSIALEKCVQAWLTCRHLAAELLSGVSLDIEDEADDSDVDDASDLDDLLAAGTPTNDVSEDELDSDMVEQDGRAAKALLPTEDRQVCWLKVLVSNCDSSFRNILRPGVSLAAFSIS